MRSRFLKETTLGNPLNRGLYASDPGVQLSSRPGQLFEPCARFLILPVRRCQPGAPIRSSAHLPTHEADWIPPASGSGDIGAEETEGVGWVGNENSNLGSSVVLT